ncbi:MAG: EamA family transporter [Gammaproteobacteria bacterium]|jgi:drug/metabolite transporter (DMT)-like permease|nr:EamA family transporter [Gammaproteobacteria bacterium]
MTSKARIAGLTAVAMMAFAANSVLCRMALESGTIDAAGVTAVRPVSGALMLWLVMAVRHGGPSTRGEPLGVVTLFLYAICFSLAYLSLTASTGTLILFASVQLTMFVAGLRAGERMAPLAWFGFFLALAGLSKAGTRAEAQFTHSK